uniref:Uncharacterized protein n=1 Tax=Hippocampus comes TaxID=109280 RepID=A0A3Q2XI20_HIPCM
MHSHYDQGRRGHEDDLQNPQTDVRDGEGLVVTHVLTAGLLRIAHVVGLLVAPHELRRRAQDEDAEDEENCEPHPANHHLHCRPLPAHSGLCKTGSDELVR